MIRWIFKIIGLLLLAVIVFFVISFLKGGDPFRWLGHKSEQAAEIVRERSEELGQEADKIKERTDSVRGTTKKIAEGLKKTGDKVKEFSGSKTD